MSAPPPGVWNCELCGEVVFSVGTPSRCPACGAWPALLAAVDALPRVLARDRSWPEAVVTGGLRAIQQEIDTAELYSRVAATAAHPALRATFRCLQRIEARHAALLCIALGTRRPQPAPQPDLAALSDAERLDRVEARENDTIRLYRSLLPLVEGTDLEVAYRALMDVEADHNAVVARLRLLLQPP